MTFSTDKGRKDCHGKSRKLSLPVDLLFAFNKIVVHRSPQLSVLMY